MRCIPVFLLSLLAAGCLQTTYRDIDETGEPPSMLERRVGYRLAPAFWSTAPRCAAIVTRPPVKPAIRATVERAVERHLTTRLPRVIGGARLRRAEAQLGLDIAAQTDRRAFARQLRCGTVMEIRLGPVGDDYAVLWARRSIDLTLSLHRARDNMVLWTATHTASRSDGGLPLSIFSVPFSAARAAIVTGDAELFASIADDAVRRMMKTLPDTRGSAVSGTALP